ncbi:MAG: peptidyl-prolyl cis-trans isomerase A (cyclophilin A) [Gammaproteobacteria bacterium]
MFNYLKGRFIYLLVTTSFLLLSFQSSATIVLIETPLGDIQIELFDDEAPVTVTNFLSYINDDSFVNSFIHRSVPGFIIQGGGFISTDNVLANVTAKSAIVNEFGRSNIRGTVAMAKVGGDPNSATSQWFINLADNSAQLDPQNGGFTVFGEVINNGMVIADAIASLEIIDGSASSAALTEVPVIDFSGTQILRRHIVFTEFSIPSDLNQFSDLQLTSAVNIQNPTAGNSVEYLVTVTNAGPDPATEIEVLDLLPAGMEIPTGLTPSFSQGTYVQETGIWQIGSLPAGIDATLTIPAIPLQFVSPECFVNEAAITDFVEIDSTKDDNTDVATVFVGGATNCVELTLTVIPSVFFDNQCNTEFTDFFELDYRIQNAGPDAAANIVLSLTGTLDDTDLADSREIIELAAGAEISGFFNSPLVCSRSDMVATYNIVAVNDTTASSDSILSVSDEFDVLANEPIVIPEPTPTPTPTPNTGGGGGCFIATAAYGSYMHPQVYKLREFRDNVLMKTSFGRDFISLYYKYSPPIANVIAENQFLRIVTRLLLTPVVFAVAFPLAGILILISLGLAMQVNRKYSCNKN